MGLKDQTNLAGVKYSILFARYVGVFYIQRADQIRLIMDIDLTVRQNV